MTNRFFLFIFILFSSILVNAQNINLDWNKSTNKFSPYFDNTELPYFQENIQGKHISKATLIKSKFAPLNSNEIKSLPTDFNQEDITLSITNGYYRKNPQTQISFTPIRNKNGIWEKLISFEIEYQYKTPSTNTKKATIWPSNSVLANGEWYKLKFENGGLYKITHSYLQNMGIDVNNINPNNIKIYSNGGKMIPQSNSAEHYGDLTEIAIHVEGESDNTFNNSDYILFYVEPTVTWRFDVNRDMFTHKNNLYSDETYCFLTIDNASAGKRITDKNNLSTSDTTITTFDDYQFHEKNQYNILKSGTHWYGDKFDFTLAKDFTFNFPGTVQNKVKIYTSLMASSRSPTKFTLKVNGTTIGDAPITQITGGQYAIQGYTNKKYDWDYTTNSNSLNIGLTYDKGTSPSSIGYIDFIDINTQRELKLYGNYTFFRSQNSTGFTESKFEVGNMIASNKIWDITDFNNIENQQFSLSGSIASFNTNTSTLRDFVVFNGNSFPQPDEWKQIENQNLHAVTTPNFVIVTHEKFIAQAQELAYFHQTHDNINSLVVNIDELYNEYSSGKKDLLAIRNFLKSIYDRPDGNELRYLLLMGDCSYDYKSTAGNTNYIPIFESSIDNSLKPTTTHSSDDIFALLDDNEGIWSSSINEILDIGVGRFPVQSANQAQAIVSKIKKYSTANVVQNLTCTNSNELVSNFGKWRNKIVFVADDEKENTLHMDHAESISTNLNNEHPDYFIDKLYVDAYPQLQGAGGQSSPTVVKKLNDHMKNGALIMNYTGHGGETGWAQERILTNSMINAWDNIENMPLLFTATCEFGRYDDPDRTSAGELTFLNANGGAIGLITTTRPVYSNSNKKINDAFYNNAFDPIDTTTGEFPRIGDLIRICKNNALGVGNRNFALLGDPALRLAYPQEEIVLTSINQSPIGNDTLQALEKITMIGEIHDYKGQKISTFNGFAFTSIYDKKSTIETLYDEYNGTIEENERFFYNLWKNKIFEGYSSVENGEFTVTFIVPKDINYQIGTGLVSMYAHSVNLQNPEDIIDANGANYGVYVGGSLDSFLVDNTPPVINLYLDDTSFIFGGMTGNEPRLIANLYDENGINTTGIGIGHEISSFIDGDKNNTFVLNDYYTTELNDYTNGNVNYEINKLAKGKHSLSLKAWDTHNNSSEAYTEFIVVEDAKLALDHVLNYPNPFSTNTQFMFDHNRAGDDLEIMVQIFTISGKLIKTLQSNCCSCPTRISNLTWDGKDDFQDNLAKGVYVYKVNVRSRTDDESTHEYQKLVILN